MEAKGKINIEITGGEPEFTSALAEGLAKELPFFEIHLAPEPTGKADLLIGEKDSLQDAGLSMEMPYLRSLPDICREIKGLFPLAEDFPKNLNCPFTAFTSGKGGSGSSSSAVLLGRVLSRAYGKKLCYVSFEQFVFSSEEKDDFGLWHYPLCQGFNPLYEYSAFDAAELLSKKAFGMDGLILDIPPGHPFAGSILSMCEDTVVVFAAGRNDKASEYIYGVLKEVSKKQKERNVFRFEPAFNPEEFHDGVPGLMSAFAAEVRGLARELGYM